MLYIWACILLLSLSQAVTTPLANINSGHPSVASTCWTCHGPFERNCFHAEPLRYEPYPLSEEMFERSLPYRTSEASIHGLFQTARNSGELEVVVIGGSVTFGHECISPSNLRDRECAWPNRLKQWCDQRVQEFKCKVLNAAKPGNNIVNFLHSDLNRTLPAESTVDIIIVDYGVNDANIQNFNFDVENVKIAHDHFVHYVRNVMIRSPAILYTENFICPARILAAPLQSLNMAEIHAEVTQQYDIPMVSFRHAIWPDMNDSAFADRIWGPKVHPGWQVHQLMADNIVYYLQKSFARFLEVDGPLPDQVIEPGELLRIKRLVGCSNEERSFQMFAEDYTGTDGPQELVDSSGWSFANDRRGKSGFIGFSGAFASFHLPCNGRMSILDVGYLHSYEGMGAAEIIVSRLGSDLNKSVVIDGLWESRASVESHEVIGIPPGADMASVTVEILSESKEKAYVDIADNNQTGPRENRKFKVTSMQCC